MGDANEFTGKFAEFEDVVGANGVKFGEFVLFEFFDARFDHADSQFEAVSWREIEFWENVRNRADVIEMAVRKDNSADAVEFVFEVTNIGNDIIDPEHVFGWKFDPDINNNDVVFVFEDGHVFADFVQAADRNDAQFAFVN